ncbi:hypothetical protein [Bradyrhizobium japonicum]|uniref:hypothetical protein n=1 Tax=Bradyrhizobium japonicum TaxID=375 RepID=UPI001E365E43|nr:hypothetical protein [Bradyrhizobium japonicum]MCD9892079.1 hypothetical protein [Bradyrhizobium japonicum]WRJ83891.1 hypothetical protein R3F78_02910 [Bradyrhizobium japonicum]
MLLETTRLYFVIDPYASATDSEKDREGRTFPELATHLRQILKARPPRKGEDFDYDDFFFPRTQVRHSRLAGPFQTDAKLAFSCADLTPFFALSDGNSHDLLWLAPRYAKAFDSKMKMRCGDALIHWRRWSEPLGGTPSAYGGQLYEVSPAAVDPAFTATLHKDEALSQSQAEIAAILNPIIFRVTLRHGDVAEPIADELLIKFLVDLIQVGAVKDVLLYGDEGLNARAFLNASLPPPSNEHPYALLRYLWSGWNRPLNVTPALILDLMSGVFLIDGFGEYDGPRIEWRHSPTTARGQPNPLHAAISKWCCAEMGIEWRAPAEKTFHVIPPGTNTSAAVVSLKSPGRESVLRALYLLDDTQGLRWDADFEWLESLLNEPRHKVLRQRFDHLVESCLVDQTALTSFWPALFDEFLGPRSPVLLRLPLPRCEFLLGTEDRIKWDEARVRLVLDLARSAPLGELLVLKSLYGHPEPAAALWNGFEWPISGMTWWRAFFEAALFARRDYVIPWQNNRLGCFRLGTSILGGDDRQSRVIDLELFSIF